MFINKVIFMGRLNADAMYSKRDQWTSCLLAIKNEWQVKSKNGTTDNVCVIDCTLWNDKAEKYKHLKKGTLVTVEGKLQTRKYKDKSGKEAYKIVIAQENIVVIEEQEQKKSAEPENMGEWDTEELPF